MEYFCFLLVLRHLVQSFLPLTFCKFGIKVLLVFFNECGRVTDDTGFLPQASQTQFLGLFRWVTCIILLFNERIIR